MWSRRTRIMVVGAVVTLGLLGTLLVQAPVPTRTVDELMLDPNPHVGDEVAVRGEVLDGSIDNNSMMFTLEGESFTLEIRYTNAAVSNGLGDKRTVYAEGVLMLEGDTYVLEASTIKTSCPSKYEEEAASD